MHLFALFLTVNCLGTVLAKPLLLRRSDPPRKIEEPNAPGWLGPLAGASIISVGSLGVHHWIKQRQRAAGQQATGPGGSTNPGSGAVAQVTRQKGVFLPGDPVDVESMKYRLLEETSRANPPDDFGYWYIWECARFRHIVSMPVREAPKPALPISFSSWNCG